MTLHPNRDRRRFERFTVTGKIKLNWKTPDGHSFAATARCLDVSETGVLLESERPVPVGALINLESADLHVAGIAAVCHCRPKGLKYLLGLEFRGGLRFRTEHLDPAAGPLDN